MAGQREVLLKFSLAIGIGVFALKYVYDRFRRVRENREPSTATHPGEKAGEDKGLEEGLWIYFGSQTGTAERFSAELEECAAEQNLKATVVDMEEFDPDEFVKHKAVILVVATYGEGDPTDNAMEFFKWIQDESLPPDTLSGLKYTVMGLGNRQYVHFNACGKIADENMERLGADRILDRGEGDDDQNIEEDFEQWKDSGLWPALQQALGGHSISRTNSEEGALGSGAVETLLKKITLKAEVRESAKDLPIDPLVQVGGADVAGKWYFNASSSQITACEEIRQEFDPAAGKTTKHLDFDVKQHPAFDWRTADNLEILPRNPPNEVEWFAEWLGVKESLDSYITFVRASGVEKAVKKPFPTPCTVRTALELYCDISMTPPKATAKRLVSLAREVTELEALERLLDDRETFQWLTGEGVRLSFREFVELFMPSAKMDLSLFLQLCPRQRSRPYTIASSNREDPHTIGVCVSAVQEKLLSLAEVLHGLESRDRPAPNATTCLERAGESGAHVPRTFRGACSTMLCTGVSCNDRLLIASRASSFRLPRKSSVPIVMLGAGTGIAPFRGFLREFRAENCVRGKTYLFFGCTNRDVDFLYKDELQDALALEPPALKELITAFSREQEEKVYVQHRLHERSKEVVELVGNGAYIYVCGSVAMGRAVREELASALGSPDLVSRLKTEGRFVEELW